MIHWSVATPPESAQWTGLVRSGPIRNSPAVTVHIVSPGGASEAKALGNHNYSPLR